MISKETFISWLNTYIEQEKFTDDFRDVLTKYMFNDFIEPYIFENHNMSAASIKAIAEAMDDDDEFILWWIEETRCGQYHPYVDYEGEVYKLDTPERLYYWLTDKKYMLMPIQTTIDEW